MLQRNKQLFIKNNIRIDNIDEKILLSFIYPLYLYKSIHRILLTSAEMKLFIKTNCAQVKTWRESNRA